MQIKFKTSIFSLIGFLAFHFYTAKGLAQSAHFFPPAQAQSHIDLVCKHGRFSLGGISFFKGKLYAASNIGLLEVDHGVVSKLWRWTEPYDVEESVWQDSQNNVLWIFHDTLEKLIRFDGTNGVILNKPQLSLGQGVGDMVPFRSSSSTNGFWMIGLGNVWKYDTQTINWQRMALPPHGNAIDFFPLGADSFFVMRVEKSFLRPGQNNFKSDEIYSNDAKWEKIPDTSKSPFFVEMTVATETNQAYFLTQDGKILSARRSEIKLLETPGICDSIIASSSGRLIASFRKEGVYQYDGKWSKKSDSPYAFYRGECWVRLAEADGKIALAVQPKPNLIENGGIYKTTYKDKSRLWILQETKIREVTIGD